MQLGAFHFWKELETSLKISREISSVPLIIIILTEHSKTLAEGLLIANNNTYVQ